MTNAPLIPTNDLRRQALADRTEVLAAISRVYDSGWYVLGREVESFEQLFADYLGVRHVIGVANGTDALEIALRTVGVQPGDEVVMTANAGGYASTAARSVGALPVYCDVCPDGSIDARSAASAVSPSTRAVVVTHLYGQMSDVNQLRHALPPGMVIIEDCAQAHGARDSGMRAGALGDVSTFSFYPTKNLAAVGDGGAVATSNDEFAAAARQLRTYGWASRYHVAIRGGRNSRLDEVQAAVLSARLAQLDQRNTRRRDIARSYRARCPFPILGRGDESDVAHLCVVVAPDRQRVRAQLADGGVASDVHYPIPDHQQPAWSTKHISLPVTEHLCASVVTLPCFPELTDTEVELVCRTLEALR